MGQLSPFVLCAAAGALALWLIALVRQAYRHDLKAIPGPGIAKFTGLYRLNIVMEGTAPQKYRKLHQTYGPAVRVGPNHVSFSDPAVIPTIYGIGSKFLKTDFYKTMVPVYKGQPMDSMFTARDPAYHRGLKTQVAQFFALSSMRNYEPYVDECTDIFAAAMRDLQGQSVDLAEWLQWYAFDVVAGLTFQRRFGFLEQRKDIDGMIGNLDTGLNILKFIGQYPELNAPVTAVGQIIRRLAGGYDPLVKFVQMCEEEIVRYDESKLDSNRTDFLSQLRQKGAESKSHDSDRDLINHLSNNLLAGSDTTAISLRACFYFLIKNPRVLDLMRREYEHAENEGRISDPITLDESLKLPYLQAIMKEAMRLHPGVGFPLERLVPPGGAELSGSYYAERTNVSVSAPVIHLDKSIFGDDADLFRPERWLVEDDAQLKKMEKSFLTFGYGARTCIGKNISIMEMGKFVPQIFKKFDIEWASEKPEWDTNAAWFWKQTNMHCRLRSRL